MHARCSSMALAPVATSQRRRSHGGHEHFGQAAFRPVVSSPSRSSVASGTVARRCWIFLRARALRGHVSCVPHRTGRAARRMIRASRGLFQMSVGAHPRNPRATAGDGPSVVGVSNGLASLRLSRAGPRGLTCGLFCHFDSMSGFYLCCARGLA